MWAMQTWAMRTWAMCLLRSLALSVAITLCFVAATIYPVRAQVDAEFTASVDVAPPPLPDYEQPPIPDTGYLWVPGYWAWADDVGYYWTPGTWVLPPEPGLLWTPGYWGWYNGAYVFYPGYWGTQVGFYGGVSYGFGYTGEGYEGGEWREGRFFYNTTVNNFGGVRIADVFSRPVTVTNRSYVSFNGGTGGTTARPTPQQVAFAHQRHVPATRAQVQNVQAAAHDPALSLAHNQGHPAVAATAHPGAFKGPGIIAARPGPPVAVRPAKAMPMQGGRPGGEGSEERKGPPPRVRTGQGPAAGEKKQPPTPEMKRPEERPSRPPEMKRPEERPSPRPEVKRPEERPAPRPETKRPEERPAPSHTAAPPPPKPAARSAPPPPKRPPPGKPECKPGERCP
jgi:hypothetical protein